MTDHYPDHAVELFRIDDTYEVYVDLPDCDPDDLDVRWRDNRLLVTAERDENGSTRVVRRHVSLPHAVDPGSIDASYDDGVLEVHLPVRPGDERPGTRVEVAD